MAAKTSAANLLAGCYQPLPNSVVHFQQRLGCIYSVAVVLYKVNTCGPCTKTFVLHNLATTLRVCWPHNSQLSLIYNCKLLQNSHRQPVFTHRNQWEACHSFLWIKMDNITGVSLQPCNFVVVSTRSPMYATPEKHAADPMREISFTQSHKSCNILRIWNQNAGKDGNQIAYA